MRISLSEGPAIRRLAAALSTSLQKSVSKNSLDSGQTTSVYFRLFPWAGPDSVRGELPKFDVSSVGQYFREFNWEGTMIKRAENEGNSEAHWDPRQTPEEFLTGLFQEGL